MTKYDEILQILRKELACGKYTAGSRFPSEQKLMHRFEASRITINKVTTQLSSDGYIIRGKKGSGTLVSEYAPFPLGTFAYVGSIDNSYSIKMVNSLQYNAFHTGYALSIFSPGSDLMQYCIDRIRCSKYLGLFVSGIGVLSSGYTLPFPIVYLDNGLPSNSVPRHSVICNNAQGAAGMIEALWKRNHREILIFTSYSLIEYSREQRVRSFAETLRAKGVADVENRIFHIDAPLIPQKEQTRKALYEALKRYPETSSIVTDSDHLALVLMRFLQEADLQKKITVTGFGNLEKNHRFWDIPSVEQHPEEIGLQAFRKMLRILNDPAAEAPSEITVDTELVNVDSIPLLP